MALFALASFFCFAPFIGLEILGVSLYAAFIFALLDVPFLIQICLKSFLQFKKSQRPLLFLFFLIFYCSWFAKNPIALIGKLTIISYFCFYCYQGTRAFGYIFVKLGVVFAVFISALQFIEANVFDYSFFLPRRWQINVAEKVIFGIGSLQGGSYDYNGVLSGLVRVSGTAMEPGHFSAVMAAALLLFYNSPIMVGLSLVGLLLAHSKIALALFILVPAIFLGWALKLRPIIVALALLLTYFLIVELTILQNPSMLQKNPSIFARTESVFALELLDPFRNIFGVGMQNACDVLSGVPRAEQLWTESELRQKPCAIGANSFQGSLLIDLGVVGSIYFLWFTSELFHLFSRSGLKKAPQPQYVASLGIIAAHFALHFLTAFPSGLLLVVKAVSIRRDRVEL